MLLWFYWRHWLDYMAGASSHTHRAQILHFTRLYKGAIKRSEEVIK